MKPFEPNPTDIAIVVRPGRWVAKRIQLERSCGDIGARRVGCEMCVTLPCISEQRKGVATPPIVGSADNWTSTSGSNVRTQFSRCAPHGVFSPPGNGADAVHNVVYLEKGVKHHDTCDPLGNFD